jgi:radical SAM protein with 4Fe4S-binding SPASM domain
MRDHLYLERAQKFDWPDLAAEESGTEFCYGLRDQIGILADGTVVPCCLDHEGDIALGNIFKMSLEEILESERARVLREGFSRRRPTEELCRRCGYASRF